MELRGEKLTPRQVIDDIRSGFIDGDGELIKSGAVQIAQDALEGYAHDLNAEVAHFIEEMLQNADDAEYQCPHPTANIIDHGTHLLFSTNETGMDEANVRAICTIRRGTKISSLNNIGEKGLGFKTTFKAANTVWIRSAGYRFRLDRTRPLGMAIPVWEDFPTHMHHLIEADKTQFLLEYRDQSRADDVRESLPKFKSTTLLFLRQLKEIKVSLKAGNTRTITRKDSRIYGGMSTELTDSQDGETTSSSFIIQKHIATCTPPSEDTKRADAKFSEVTIAFPLAEQDKSKQQFAHNFLPIRLTTFRFLINADFKLLQNRADLDGDRENSRWNFQLMQGLAQCFVSAVKRMNAFQEVRLKWIPLLPIDEVHDSFEPLRARIQELIHKAPVLFSAAGPLANGGQLLQVSEEFRDAHNKLFFDLSDGAGMILSTIYEACDITHLKFLGIKKMDRASFLLHLRNFVSSKNGKTFRNQSEQWHAELSQLLLTYPSSRLTNVQLIPLTDGCWTSSGRDIFFSCSTDADEFDVPFDAGSIGGLSFVSKNASLNSHWRKLMTHLGVEPLDKSKVCAKIHAAHEKAQPPTLKNLTTLLSHAKFLFECGDRLFHKLYVVNSDNKIVSSVETYMDDPKDTHPVSALLGAAHRGKLLHEKYVTLMSHNEDKNSLWLNYLRQNVQVRTKLRLTKRLRNGENLSEELKDVASRFPNQVLLSALVEGWPQIAHLVTKPKSPGFQVNDSSGFCLRDLSVETQNHGLQQLKNTALPLASLLHLNLSDLKFLKLDNIDSSNWKRLGVLGVLCSDDTIDIQLLILKNAKESSMGSEAVSEIYKRIQNLCRRSATATQSAVKFFSDDAYILDPSGKTWMNVKDCLWSNSFEFLPHLVLANHYVECQVLFQEILRVPEATFDTVLTAMKDLRTASSEDTSKCYQMLMTASQHIRGSSDNVRKLILSECMKNPLIPLRCSGEVKFVSLDSDEEYLLIDRESYEAAFAGDRCWQVACTPSQARLISNLFDPVGALSTLVKTDHRISYCIKEEAVYLGDFKIDVERTEWLMEKVPFLKAIAIAENPRDVSVAEQVGRLEQLTIFYVDQIEIKPYYENSSGRKVYGKTRPGTVHIDTLQHSSDQCNIYVDAKMQGVKGQASFFGQIGNQLLSYLKISKAPRKACLNEILTADSDATCLEILRLKAISVSEDILKHRPKPKSCMVQSGQKNNQAINVNGADVLQDSASTVSGITTALAGARLSTAKNKTIGTFLEHHQGSESEYLDNGISTSKTISTAREEKDRRTGIKGELFIYNALKKALGADLNQSNWTSELRHEADPKLSAWVRPDARDYADFTILSRNDKLVAWLSQHVDKATLEKSITPANSYHLEVKATNGSAGESFHWSNYQLNHARMLHGKHDEVYIIIRVSRLAREPCIHIIVDPIEKWYTGHLKIQGAEGLLCTIED